MTTPDRPEHWRGERESGDNEPEWWERVIDGADPAGQRGLNGHQAPDPEDLPDEFVPPDPGPLPAPTPPVVLSVVGVISGLILILKPRWLSDIIAVDSTIVMVLGLILLLAGVATLVYRLRDPDPEDDDELPPDNGAVV